MKKVTLLKRILPLAFAALFSISAFGKGNVFIHSYLKTDYAIVSAQNSFSEAFKVTIVNAAGETLYSSPRIKSSNSFQKLFDLSSVDNGDYKVILSGKNARVVESFSIVDHKLVKKEGEKLADEEKANTFFRTSGDKLYISHLNFLNDELTIKINDIKGDEVYNSELPSKSTYSGLFDISKLPAGNYQVCLTSGEKVYSYDFRK